jgi:hypothetical protein
MEKKITGKKMTELKKATSAPKLSASSMAERGRNKSRMNKEFFNPRQKISKKELKQKISWLVNTAKTDVEQKSLSSDISKLIKNYSSNKSSKPRLSSSNKTIR